MLQADLVQLVDGRQTLGGDSSIGIPSMEEDGSLPQRQPGPAFEGVARDEEI